MNLADTILKIIYHDEINKKNEENATKNVNFFAINT